VYHCNSVKCNYEDKPKVISCPGGCSGGCCDQTLPDFHRSLAPTADLFPQPRAPTQSSGLSRFSTVKVVTTSSLPVASRANPSPSGCTAGSGSCGCTSGICGNRGIEIRTAHDPNAKHGPERVAPGEWITYTIEYENTGEGTAYGGYVEDDLPPGLDASTLQIGNGGVYLPSQHQVIWSIGEVASHTGGLLSLGVRISPGAISGTVLVNRAAVYFPSVPEKTPTNDIVSLVQTAAAHPQQVETTEGQSVAITLSGSRALGGPLTYQVVEQPRNGALGGIAPHVVYTPATNFEGLDDLMFQVRGGADTSLPAEVSIVVRTGVETTPPTVLSVSPLSGAQDVLVYSTPVYSGSSNYWPYLWAQFSEPISATTVMTPTFHIVDNQGRWLVGKPIYDAGLNRATYVLEEPLRKLKTYTVTLTTGVRDTSGNALPADYMWSFRTEVFSVYLPLVIK